MRHALTMLALAALCLGPAAVGTAQDPGYQEGAYQGRSPSVIRPVGFGPLWNGYPGQGYGDCGCGCGVPAPCPCDPCGSCGPVCDPCNSCRHPILGGLHHTWHKMTRSLDCLFPCRPRLNGDCSGCGTCGIPCGKAYCPRCRPRLLPLLHHGFGPGNGGCASCCAPVAGFAQPLGAPVVEPAPTSDPFQDDPSTPPASTETDARVERTTHSAQASVLRRTGPMSVVRPSVSSRLASQAKPAPALPRVQRAAHSTQTLKRENSILRRVSAEGDEATHDAPAAGIQTDNEPLPFNPLR